MVINYGRVRKFPFSIVRYHNIYGPRMGYEHVIPEFCVRILKRTDPFPIFGADGSRAFCYVDDAVEATKRVMESVATDGHIIHVGNPDEETTIEDLARRMFDLFDLHPTVEIHPAPRGSVKRRCPDISKLKKLTSYRPQVSLADGLRRTFAWYEEATSQCPSAD